MSEMNSAPDPLNLLADEFAARYRRGERPALSEYTARYPDLAEQILELFPALIEMEQFAVATGGGERGTSPFTSPAALSEPVPDRLGDFRILREIARGGMGVVYEAVQESLGRHVALKVMPRYGLADSRLQERFRREARAAALLHHTNIVPVFGVGECDGVHYYAMQFIRGQSLDLVLQEVRRLRGAGVSATPGGGRDSRKTSSIASGLASDRFAGGDESPAQTVVQESSGLRPAGEEPDRTASALSASASSSSIAGQFGSAYYRSVARIGVQAAEALAYAHHQKLLHRDIKPSNLLLDLQGTLWVTDFGLVKAEENDALTRTGDIVGTLRYMAPERFSGQADARSDVYALGLTLYEMLTLRPAFESDQRAQLIDRIIHEEPVRPRRIDPRIPLDLETITLKAMAKDPADRYRTAGELAEDLRRFLGDRSILARRATPLEQARRWCRRNPALAVATVATAAALVAVAALAVLYADREHRLAVAREDAATKIKVLADELSASLVESNRLLSGRNFDRAQAAFENEQVGPGLLWMVESWRAAVAAGDPAMRRLARANLSAWLPYHPRLRAVFSHSGPVEHAAFSPDGRTIFTAGEDGAARLWDASSGRAVGAPLSHPDTVLGVCFSGDGKTLYTACNDGTVRYWDAASGKEVGAPLKNPKPVLGLALSPDGATLAAGCADGMIHLWDVAARSLRVPPFWALNNPTKWYLAFSKDSRLLVTPSSDGRLIRDAATGRPIGPTINNPARTSSVALSSDGKVLLTGGTDGSARLWDAVTGRPLTPPLKEHSDRVRHVAFSPDGEIFLTASTDKSARLWDAATGRPIGVPLHHQAPVRSAVFSPDGASFVTTSGDGGAQLWETKVYDPVRLVFESPASFSADGKAIVTTSGDTARIRDADTGKPLGANLRLPGSEPVAVSAFGPAGKDVLALTRNSGGSARLWNASAGKIVCRLSGPPDQVLDPLALSPDGKVVVTAKDEIIRLWDAATGMPIGAPLRHPGHVYYVAFSLDGGRMAVGYGPNAVLVWDVKTGTALGQPFTYPGSDDAVALSADGALLAVAGEDGTARVWNVETRTPLSPPLIHGGWIWTVAFSPDGRFLATGSGSNTVRVWDVATGRVVGPALRHPGPVQKVSFSPNGMDLLTRDNLTRVFQREPEIPDDLELVANWVEVVTGLALEPKQGAIRLLDNETWLASRERLLRRVGLPPPRSSPGPHPFPLGINPVDRGHALLERGRWNEAETVFNKLVAANPDEASTWTARGEFYLMRGQHEKAAADLLSAAQRDDGDPQRHYRAAIARLLNGDLAGYRASCAELVERSETSGSLSAANRAAYACIYAPNAVADMGRVVRLAERSAPQFAGAERIVGAALYRAGRHDEALRQFNRSHKSFKPIAWDWLFLAMIHGRLGHAEDARRNLARARRVIADADAAETGGGRNGSSRWGNLYARPTIMLLLAEAEAVVLFDPIFPLDPFVR